MQPLLATHGSLTRVSRSMDCGYMSGTASAPSRVSGSWKARPAGMEVSSEDCPNSAWSHLEDVDRLGTYAKHVTPDWGARFWNHRCCWQSL